MTTTLLSAIAVILYIAAGWTLARRLSRQVTRDSGRKNPVILALIASGCHVIILYYELFTLQGINFGFFNAVSLLSWLIALFLIIASFTKPVENLGIAIFPLAGLGIILSLAFPSEHVLSPQDVTILEAHILISIIAYSFLSLAAVQAILLSIQDKHLHNKHPGGFIRALPPLQTMETLMFQMIAMGFVLQSFSLISGFIFLDDMFAQHLVHKTILSILAWIIFATLLWGRWRFGWRGKIAIRWTLGGFASLLLAYLGSKMVLEIMLGR
jgi:ABC-type uncharacterized transport system permease subunit